MTVLVLLVLISISNLVWTKCPDNCTCVNQELPSFSDLPGINGPSVLCRYLHLTTVPTHFNPDTQIINIDGNNIPLLEIIDFGGNTMNLRHVQADNSQVKEIGRFDADGVTHLVLKSNNFTEVPRTSKTVLFLHLSDNQIPHDNELNLMFYINLKRLELNNNKFITIPVVPSSLRQLFLTNNKISFVDNTILRSAPNLELLSLQFNNLFKISLPEAYFMTKFTELHLEDNPHITKDKSVERCCKNELIQNIVCQIPTEI